jgi:ribose 5-phosphate isomerase A
VATTDELKRRAAYHAAGWIEDRMVVGLGTGSTVHHLLTAIAEARARGELSAIVGIPTSEDTRGRSEALGIPLSDLTAHPRVDLTLDGTDEFDPSLDLIKGLGGALLREKLVAIASERVVVLADESKRVGRLGEKAPLPVEVDPFGIGIQEPFLRELGCEPHLRRRTDGGPLVTDGGNYIFDCTFVGGIPDPAAIAAALDSRPGIVEHGLFLAIADVVVVAGGAGVQDLRRNDQL